MQKENEMTDTIDREHNGIHFERVLEATAEEAFDAWTQASEITNWWDPTGAPLVACSIDLRPQGAFRFVTAGHAPPFEGTYDVVERPHRLGFRAMGAQGTVTFTGHARGTLMKVTIQCASAEHFEMFVKHGVAAGTSATLNNLVKELGRRRLERARSANG